MEHLTLSSERLSKIAKTVFNAPKSQSFLQQSATLTTIFEIKLPKVHTTTYGLKSWRYTAAKLWNALPETERQTINLIYLLI